MHFEAYCLNILTVENNISVDSCWQGHKNPDEHRSLGLFGLLRKESWGAKDNTKQKSKGRVTFALPRSDSKKNKAAKAEGDCLLLLLLYQTCLSSRSLSLYCCHSTLVHQLPSNSFSPFFLLFSSVTLALFPINVFVSQCFVQCAC